MDDTSAELLFRLLFILYGCVKSCFFHSVDINGKKSVGYQQDDVSVVVSAHRFTYNHVNFIVVSDDSLVSERNLTMNDELVSLNDSANTMIRPDSIRYRLRVRRADGTSFEPKVSYCYWSRIENNSVKFCIKWSQLRLKQGRCIELDILPSPFITRNGQPLVTDTLHVRLMKRKTLERTIGYPKKHERSKSFAGSLKTQKT